MLTLEGVVIRQGSFQLSANWRLESGVCLAVMGPSGAGKSTLINAIAGFVPITAGAILWNGTPIHTLPVVERPLSILFQDHNMLPHLTLFQNVALGTKPSLKLSAEERDAVLGVLRDVGLEELEARKPGQVSGGQIGRAGLARVLLRDRPLLLLDEPFSALGPALRKDMLSLVASWAKRRGTTVMMITHAPEDAERICPYTTLVSDGSAAAPVATEALLRNPPAAMREYLG